MKLPTYVWIAPQKELEGAGYVLQTAEPHYIGRIIKLQEDFGVINWKVQHEPLFYAQCSHYNIVVSFSGRLASSTLQMAGSNWKGEIQAIVDGMANWYVQEKINNNLKYYKRYIL